MIEVSDLRFEYQSGGEELFDGLTHTFEDGMFSVVTGPSGRGKSTLLYLIGQLLSPSAGSINLDGVPTTGLSDRERSLLRSERIGFVFQDAALDSTRSVLDNVVEGGLYAGLGRRQSERRARQLLDRFGVELRDDHKPGQVSGGQAQRVGLCRALVKHPRIILADEPTGNLDQVSADVVLAALSEQAGAGATVIVASHDPNVTSRAGAVCAL
ncbi:MAG: ABC transporter ATP-binding protein [Acidimicrobiia bacterium]